MSKNSQKKIDSEELESSLNKEILALTPAEINVKVGEIIRQERMRLKLEIDQISNDIKIRRFFLESIEKGQFDQLPGGVYTMGFIKSYVDYIGIDPKEVFEALGYSKTLEVEEPVYKSYVVEKKSFSMPKGLVLSATSLAAVLTAYLIYNHTNTDDVYVSPSSRQSLEYTIKDAPTVPPENEIVLTASKATWIKITDTEGKFYNAKLLRPGEFVTLKEYEGKKLSAGNVYALNFAKNGESKPLKAPGSENPDEAINSILEDFVINVASIEESFSK
jgi:cytoskeletal protein RodZ